MIALSMLDRSRIRTGEDAPAALRATVRLAQRAEALGLHRFWVSEHHGVPGVAGSAPAVLAAAVAAATSRIRVGTGGVMLPNHRPLVVAEQFGVLESLFPGRIDLGVGRSLGFTPAVRAALGVAERGDLRSQLDELMGYFTPEGVRGVRARPSLEVSVPLFVLATGPGAAVETAAELGLPLVLAAARGEEQLYAAADRYHAAAPGGRGRLLLALDVAVADTAAEARALLLPEAWSGAYARSRGDYPALPGVAEALAAPLSGREREDVERSLGAAVFGPEAVVGERLADLVERTRAAELLATTSTPDRDELLASHRRLARLLESL
ncbi:MsnO8 family LLM class oxidoreductase [Phaeacidiphilus oryzae]|uniref:MsnO8 family LLM class oxidoreductase n=1 Tax=Phaeacidiphilus oryzae TaxID=348818 RepID=UPI00056CD0C5|nr:MsnO8 family LLM class oxidoreductase [Phaeacidiphilus oryzae]